MGCEVCELDPQYEVDVWTWCGGIDAADIDASRLEVELFKGTSTKAAEWPFPSGTLISSGSQSIK